MQLEMDNSNNTVFVLYSLSVLVTEKMPYHALEECKLIFLCCTVMIKLLE